MDFQKSWKSNPIQSWSGGHKLADMPGAAPKMVQSKLSTLLTAEVKCVCLLLSCPALRGARDCAARCGYGLESATCPPRRKQEPFLVAFAERLWGILCAHPAGREAAERHLAYLRANQFESRALGATGWNAFSFNLDFPTAAHLDSKNVAGSYSALVRVRRGIAVAPPATGVRAEERRSDAGACVRLNCSHGLRRPGGAGDRRAVLRVLLHAAAVPRRFRRAAGGRAVPQARRRHSSS